MTADQVLGGRYRLIERLGEGGMSVVWRGYDEVLGRPVAVKMLTARYAADAGWRGQIQLEAQAAGRLSHPHITNVHDYGESETESGERAPYVVMELLSGHTLAEELKAGPLPLRRHCGSADRWPAHWPRRTPAGWCTAISRPPT